MSSMSSNGTAASNTTGMAGSSNLFAPYTLPVDQAPSSASNITIYFPVNAHVSTIDVQIYGLERVITPDRVVNLDTIIPYTLLQSFFSYQQDPSNRDNILVSTSTDSLSFIQNLSTCFNNQTDCAEPFVWWKNGVDVSRIDASYSNSNSPLFHYTNFYELLLSQITYDILGHPLAQAGIENDNEIIASLISHNIHEILVSNIQTMNQNKKNIIYKQMFSLSPARFQVDTFVPNPIPFSNGDNIRFEVTLDPYSVYTHSNVDSFQGTNFYIQPNNLNYVNYGQNTYTVNIKIGS